LFENAGRARKVRWLLLSMAPVFAFCLFWAAIELGGLHVFQESTGEPDALGQELAAGLLSTISQPRR